MNNNVLFLLDGGTKENLIKKLKLNAEEYNIEALNSNKIPKNSILYTLIQHTKHILSYYGENAFFSIPINNIEYQLIKKYSIIIIQCIENNLTIIVKIYKMSSVEKGWANLYGEVIYNNRY